MGALSGLEMLLVLGRSSEPFTALLETLFPFLTPNIVSVKTIMWDTIL